MPFKINLGCGDDLRKDYLNVDCIPAAYFTEHEKEENHYLCYDLKLYWPWHDNEIDQILAQDILEHLPDKIHTMNEVWRVLKPGGKIIIGIPTTDGNGAFQDPTHVSFWNRHSFWYFEDGNPYRNRFAASYGIKARFKIWGEKTQHTADGPYLKIILEAVK